MMNKSQKPTVDGSILATQFWSKLLSTPWLESTIENQSKKHANKEAMTSSCSEFKKIYRKVWFQVLTENEFGNLQGNNIMIERSHRRVSKDIKPEKKENSFTETKRHC